ncbi:Fic/DOC family protein [Flexibacter flexilis DSM 6793]|uniref:Fic/DOC family protein n=2 Tax=Flexibacter flexilis TaxID=998 RepID=A0A1I1DP23_9BACT|nr:Fic/DOC family protein [Flexibacter flexilis DSM 6793]
MDSIDYEKFCMISIVYNSSKIEGCSLTETDTKVLLENNITAQGKPLTDHLMVKDHFNAFVKIKQDAINKRKLSIEFIQEINALVMKSTGAMTSTISGDFDTSKGDLRLAQVYVDKKYFPDFKKIPNLLGDLVKNINDRIDKVKGDDIIKLSADIHYNFVNIHPFGDVNGRTTRLLMNYIQLYHHEPLIKIFTEDRAEYIDSLNETEEKEDLNIFRDFICRQQIKFYESELDKFQKSKSGFSLLF